MVHAANRVVVLQEEVVVQRQSRLALLQLLVEQQQRVLRLPLAVETDRFSLQQLHYCLDALWLSLHASPLTSLLPLLLALTQLLVRVQHAQRHALRERARHVRLHGNSVFLFARAEVVQQRVVQANRVVNTAVRAHAQRVALEVGLRHADLFQTARTRRALRCLHVTRESDANQCWRRTGVELRQLRHDAHAQRQHVRFPQLQKAQTVADGGNHEFVGVHAGVDDRLLCDLSNAFRP